MDECVSVYINSFNKFIWNQPQKTAKNNIISEEINNKKPILKPFTTNFVWSPRSDSIKTLINHIKKIIINKVNITEIIIQSQKNPNRTVSKSNELIKFNIHKNKANDKIAGYPLAGTKW